MWCIIRIKQILHRYTDHTLLQCDHDNTNVNSNNNFTYLQCLYVYCTVDCTQADVPTITTKFNIINSHSKCKSLNNRRQVLQVRTHRTWCRIYLSAIKTKKCMSPTSATPMAVLCANCVSFDLPLCIYSPPRSFLSQIFGEMTHKIFLRSILRKPFSS